MRLVLASASPRRAELLRAAGFPFDVHPVDVDERVRDGETPSEYVRRLAVEKAAAFAGQRGADAGNDSAMAGDGSVTLVLGADTAVVVDAAILGKPANDEDARRMLRQLSGRAHLVMTGVCLLSVERPDARHLSVDAVDTTTVWFSQLSDDEIDWYVSSGEGRDKAGAYAIQGLASRFIPRIDGSYSNVVGLPISTVRELATRFHVPKFR